MRDSRSYIEKIYDLHWTLILLICATASVGFVVLYSAAEGNFNPWALKQMLRFMAFLPIMMLIAVIDIKFWLKSAYFIYGIMLIALVLTEIVGATVMGAQRWLRLGPINLQPSELMKLCLIFALARYFHGTSLVNVGRISFLITPILLVLVPVGLIMKQPDLGTSLILLMLGGAMFFVAGVKIWKFIVVLLIGLAVMPVAWSYMHDYQKNRVLAFLNPENDPLGTGYNILQSKIAIGSGGLSGKGFLAGTQSQLSFLPEKQTDFIFTMLSEEFGLLGGLSVLSLYSLIIITGLIIALSSRSHFGRMMAFGVTTFLFLHVFVNTAMVMGMIPVVGAPLPLISYGGTIMITMMTGFGLLLNVHVYSSEYIERDRNG